jgi:predicted nicotinamide N-methyase
MGFSHLEKKFIRRVKNKKSKIGQSILFWADAKRGLLNKAKRRRQRHKAMRTRNGN